MIAGACFLILWGFLAPEPAYAYIDPGMGALAWQMLLAGVFGAAFFIHRMRQWIADRWKALRSRGKSPKDVP
ncbi:MAG: hypothetical protein A3A86_05865 [Elusimicrobia bacterium RIFCSPLOWO2_01_FULL_60_11]|nr:MAG: hypothetical protein A3A86_05865 [Elusimicrobia bacterium RIFCSPLOWO2_01_FULL_60_11]